MCLKPPVLRGQSQPFLHVTPERHCAGGQAGELPYFPDRAWQALGFLGPLSPNGPSRSITKLPHPAEV